MGAARLLSVLVCRNYSTANVHRAPILKIFLIYSGTKKCVLLSCHLTLIMSSLKSTSLKMSFFELDLRDDTIIL